VIYELRILYEYTNDKLTGLGANNQRYNLEYQRGWTSSRWKWL